MKITRRTRHGIDRYPCNSTRLLIPTIAVRGFAGRHMQITFGFWIWRADFEINWEDGK